MPIMQRRPWGIGCAPLELGLRCRGRAAGVGPRRWSLAVPPLEFRRCSRPRAVGFAPARNAGLQIKKWAARGVVDRPGMGI